jgi:hypothetical protein
MDFDLDSFPSLLSPSLLLLLLQLKSPLKPANLQLLSLLLPRRKPLLPTPLVLPKVNEQYHMTDLSTVT